MCGSFGIVTGELSDFHFQDHCQIDEDLQLSGGSARVLALLMLRKGSCLSGDRPLTQKLRHLVGEPLSILRRPATDRVIQDATSIVLIAIDNQIFNKNIKDATAIAQQRVCTLHVRHRWARA